MKRINILKYEENASKHILHLYSRIFMCDFVTKMRSEDLYAGADYFFYLTELNNELEMFTLLPVSDKAKRLFDTFYLTQLSIDTAKVDHAFKELILLNGKDLTMDKGIYKAVKKINTTPWILYEDFGLYRSEGNKRSDKNLIHEESDDLALHKRLIVVRLKEDYIKENDFAPLLFWLIAEPLFMEIFYSLKDKWPSLAKTGKNIYENNFMRFAECHFLEDLNFDEIAKHLIDNFRRMDGEKFAISITQYVQHDFYNLPDGNIPVSSLFRDTKTLAGIAEWRKFVTVENIKNMFEHMTFHVGAYSGGEYIADKTLGDYIFDKPGS